MALVGSIGKLGCGASAATQPTLSAASNDLIMTSESIDHDQLFKQLLETFFWEFIELFLPETLDYLEPGVCTFLQQEFFTDLTTGDRRIIDLLAEVNIRGQEGYFLIHLEHQSYAQAEFEKRMFHYFAYLHQKHNKPIFPIVIFSFHEPLQAEPNQFVVEFPNLRVLEFRYTAIQLNRLNWQQYLQQQNPVAAALMAKMQIDPKDRPKVKAECLRMLATLKLDPARMQLISGFVDTYLRLNQREETAFQTELDRMGLAEREVVMEIVTSWMEQGIQQGLQQGLQQKQAMALRFLLNVLQRRFESIPQALRTRLQKLSAEQLEAAMDAALTANSLREFMAQLPKTATSKTAKPASRKTRSSQVGKSPRRGKSST